MPCPFKCCIKQDQLIPKPKKDNLSDFQYNINHSYRDRRAILAVCITNLGVHKTLALLEDLEHKFRTNCYPEWMITAVLRDQNYVTELVPSSSSTI
jgi:hypothetical protein